MILNNLHPKLSGNYIVREIESTPVDEKSKIVVRLLRNLDDRVPMARVRIYDYGRLPPKEDFEDHVKYTRDFFKYILSLDLSPDDRTIIKEQFIKKAEKNEKKSRWLYTKNKPLSSELHRLPHHQLPPYTYEWRESILGKYYSGDLENLNFTKKILGRGTFSYVYLVLGKKGEKYALKLFNPSWKFPMGCNVKALENNVKENQDLLKEFPKFTNVKAFSPRKQISEPWYLMDFVGGKPANRRFLGKDPVDGHLKKLATKEYAEMLRFLHSRDFVFYDNSWGAMMINDDREFSFIDFDFITRVGKDPPVRCFTMHYVSRDQLKETGPVTKNIDLESFAKMLDHVYVGRPLIESTQEFRKFEKERKYPQERKQKLPEELGDIVEQVLIDPECNISINDFYNAIEI